ncbi:uncharacterized protein LOC114527115 isoform X2 [Dendronephthya gigantea]|uniref:uncharacterized protein LOC114527115 isoform X2 n=1 Tax=Dendronephthya gigantea TaxID=151771 RepID=UPI00106BBC4D|nr:uncharacterized protein LOC114527115 isoform X2 [Dendronephthya gigantea]
MQRTQDNFERSDREILSPRRLDPCRFSEFTKSSYIPETVKEKPLRQQSRDKAKNPPRQYNGYQKIVKETDVTIVESSIYVEEENTRNSQQRNASDDSFEPLRKNKNVHDRHLSLEEEEWERKHLSPKRLDETRWLNFVNEDKGDVRTTSSAQPGIYIQEERSRVKDLSADVRSSPKSERLIEINVERSPALRKLIKQDEISEEPVRKVTTRASVQSSPSWNDADEVVIINRNQSPKKAGDVYILESKNDNISSERVRPRSLKYKEKVNFLDENSNSLSKSNPTSPTRIKHTVIIEDDEQTINHDDSYLNRKRVGKVNLGLWEQNASSQSHTNNPNLSVNASPTFENRSKPRSPSNKQSSFTVNGDNSSQRDLDHMNKQSMTERSPQEDSAYTSQRSLNKSMSEDELAWEKRFSKTYERKISVEEPKQRKISDQRIPRLNDVDEKNHVNFGTISLDEDEVRRVRKHKTDVRTKDNYSNEDSYIALKSSSKHGQSFNPSKSSPNARYSVGDISQLTEEELSWEEKTSRPGRLDLSKFSQFI